MNQKISHANARPLSADPATISTKFDFSLADMCHWPQMPSHTHTQTDTNMLPAPMSKLVLLLLLLNSCSEVLGMVARAVSTYTFDADCSALKIEFIERIIVINSLKYCPLNQLAVCSAVSRCERPHRCASAHSHAEPISITSARSSQSDSSIFACARSYFPKTINICGGNGGAFSECH